MLFQISMTACSFIYKCKQLENMKKTSIFPFELRRQAKNCQGIIKPRTAVENISFLIKNLIFLGAGKNSFPNEGLI